MINNQWVQKATESLPDKDFLRSKNGNGKIITLQVLESLPLKEFLKTKDRKTINFSGKKNFPKLTKSFSWIWIFFGITILYDLDFFSIFLC